jgi:NADH-quinone oxidoreductase subunit N
MFSLSQLLPILPEIMLIEGLFILCLWHLAFAPQNRNVKMSYIHYSLLLFALVLGGQVWTSYEGIFFQGTFLFDSSTHFLKILLLSCALLIFLMALFIKELRVLFSFENIVLFYFSILGGMCVFSAADLLVLFVALELHVLPIYLLLVSQKQESSTLEATVKYFILGGFSSCCLLMGISFLYGASGTTQFVDLYRWSSEQIMLWGNMFKDVPYVGLGMVFVLGAFCFKLSLVPFHLWTPDVYQGSRTSMTFFLATCGKIVAVGMVARFICEVIVPLHTVVKPFLTYAAFISMIWGGMGALYQTNVKRMMAYSTIAHMGYLASALAVGGSTGFSVILFYLAIYAPTVLMLFACLLVREGCLPREELTLESFRMLRERSPYLAMMMTLLLLTMAGLPPFPLFFGKLMLFWTLVSSKNWLLTFGLAFSSLIGCYYYLRVIKVMFFDEPEAATE